MRLQHTIILVVAVFLIFSIATRSGAQSMTNETSLDEKQQSIVTIAAFTASGELDRLKPALVEGLDAGLTINEIKEVLVQMYAYAGFPRSLNGIFTFMGVLEERKAQGIEDEVGKEASPLPADMDRDEYGARIRAQLSGLDEVPPPAAWQKFSPVIDSYLKEHLFADIFARDVLDHQARELATIAALANMTGTAGQLKFHFGAAMNSGLTEAQMQDFIVVLDSRVGEKEAAQAKEVLQSVLSERK
ncbi:carboxymuconolactone decarboxylase [Oceanidesulfovibrio marinus]|uniref:Carboxymuconolactone decarboxylase n=2 Tax=Oceanidesulfovibrio marinus TaxID=370038 RepID=A0A6P1ZD54_9BACT|nr:carboxymuconolactone decarboxylase family protein [Oceanidesulfovibrio marinus]TVM32118.1 carboxymuconolactone decarboxylase [Oceanidesulfovibrio marinus]